MIYTMQLNLVKFTISLTNLFLIYINDLHNAIKFSKVHHFTDNLFMKDKSHKKFEKLLNLNLKYLWRWLKANKISLNAVKLNLQS